MKQYALFMLMLMTAAFQPSVAEETLTKEKTLLFSHKFHLDLGFECTMCHVTAEVSVQAQDYKVPTHDECGICHDVFESEEACKKCHVDPENPVALPIVERQTIVSHEKHMTNESLNLTCDFCHKGLENVTFATEEQVPEMAVCMSCHDDARAPSRCATCHLQPMHELKPADHVTDFVTSHKHMARTEENQCLSCHVQQYCQDCHEGVFAVAARSAVTDQYIPFEPEVSHSSKGQAVKRVHVLGYRNIHGIDAKSKLASCAGCHDTGTFCTDCHTSETSDARLRPVWHGGTDWGALAGVVGSGGGRHADMARRDMELCVACHDEVTQDPVCMMCHLDRNPGKGNDPKTHAIGFMHDDQGEWHDDEMSMCFDCHQNTRVAGLGFCGYCHGMED